MPCDSRFSEYDNTHFNLSDASIVIAEGHDNILHDSDMCYPISTLAKAVFSAHWFLLPTITCLTSFKFLQVYTRCWKDSVHVSHYLKHRKEYEAEVVAFMERVGMIEPSRQRATSLWGINTTATVPPEWFYNLFLVVDHSHNPSHHLSFIDFYLNSYTIKPWFMSLICSGIFLTHQNTCKPKLISPFDINVNYITMSPLKKYLHKNNFTGYFSPN